MTNLEKVRDGIECFNDPARRHRAYDHFAQSMVLHGYDDMSAGLTGLKELYHALWNAFPDIRLEVEELFEHEDRVVLRFVITGTHQGPIFAIPVSGRPVRMNAIALFRFAEGLCVERWSVVDYFMLIPQIVSSHVSGL